MKTVLIICCLLPCSLFGQNEDGWKLFNAGIGVSSNVYWSINRPPTAENFLSDPSQINEGSSELNTRQYTSFSQNYTIHVGFMPKNEHQVLNFNASLSFYNPYSSGSSVAEGTIIDTVTLSYSNGNQETWYIDSLNIKRDTYFHNLRVLSVGADYILRTKQRMLTAYIGGGLQFGISVASNVRNVESETYRSRYLDTNGYEVQFIEQGPYLGISPYSYFEESIDYEVRELKSKTVFSVSPYIPFGIEIRPFIDRELLGRFGIDLNGKVGLDMRFMGGTSPYVMPFWNFGTGLKYFFQ